MAKQLNWTDPHARDRGHHLLTQECVEGIPATNKRDCSEVYLKFFSPYSGWTWYLCQFDPEDGRAFGLVRGLEVELGYFNMYELAEIRFEKLGNVPAVERDLHWKPRLLAEVEDAVNNEIIL